MCGSSPPYPLLHSFVLLVRPSIPLVALCPGYEGIRECSAQRAAKQLIEHLTARTQHTDKRDARHDARHLILNRAIPTVCTSTYSTEPPSTSAPSQAHPDSQGSFLFPLPPLLFQVVCVGRAHRRHASNRGSALLSHSICLPPIPPPYPYLNPWAFLRSYRPVRVHGIDIKHQAYIARSTLRSTCCGKPHMMHHIPLPAIHATINFEAAPATCRNGVGPHAVSCNAPPRP
jgi:hypothetical protein